MIIGPVGVSILGVAVLVRAVRLVLTLRRERRAGEMRDGADQRR